MTTGSGKFLESDPFSNQCSELILGLLWRWSCCHNHSGNCFSRARHCSLLEMGGWNSLNPNLLEMERMTFNSWQEQPGDTWHSCHTRKRFHIICLCCQKKFSYMNKTKHQNIARTESVTKRSLCPLVMWNRGKRFQDQGGRTKKYMSAAFTSFQKEESGSIGHFASRELLAAALNAD